MRLSDLLARPIEVQWARRKPIMNIPSAKLRPFLSASALIVVIAVDAAIRVLTKIQSEPLDAVTKRNALASIEAL